MNAEIISIGDELLIGQVVNTNASFISRALNAIGIGVNRVTTIGDDMSVILHSFRQAWKENEVVIVTGGLGPTHDDISKAAVSKFFNRELRLNEQTLKEVEERFTRFGYRTMPESNMGQAMVPEDFEPLRNEKGTAPGLFYQEEDQTFVILPGVPHEMEWLMQAHVLPRLQQSYTKDLEVIRHRTILTTGIGESSLAEKIGDPSTFLGNGVSLAFLPKSGSVRLRITGKGKDRDRVESEIARVEQHIRKCADAYVYGVENDTLEANIIALLAARGKTLCTAESCTGGMIASRITEVAGASKVFPGAIVAYANEVKKSVLEVDNTSLTNHGAVSEEVAIEMAEGALTKLSTDYALSSTGIAGPDGGTPEKPVGTVWIALAERGSATTTRKLQLAFDRGLNRERATNAALEMLRRRILAQE